MEEWPQETLLLVFSFLTPKDSFRICVTCKSWNDLWQDKHLWKHFHFLYLGGKPQPPLLPKAWKRSIVDFETNAPQSELDRFIFAASRGHSVIVESMIQSNPDLLQKCKKDERIRDAEIFGYARKQPPKSVVEYAAEGGQFELVKLLMEKYYAPQGGEVHDDKLATQLVHALWLCCHGDENVPLVEYLLRYIPAKFLYWSPNERDYLLDDVCRGPLATIQMVLEKMRLAISEPPEPRWIMRFHVTRAMYRDPPLPEVIEYLITQPEFVPGPASSAPLLVEALQVDNKCRQIVRILLSHGETVDDWGQVLEGYVSGTLRDPPRLYPFIDKKVMKWLLRRHEEAQGCKEENLALYCVPLRHGDGLILEFLTKLGALDINRIDPETGETLLHFAVREGHLLMVDLLLRNGADPKLKGMKAPSCLSIARQKNWVTIVELLQDKEKEEAPSSKKRKRKEEEEGREKEKEKIEKKIEEKEKKRKKKRKEEEVPKEQTPEQVWEETVRNLQELYLELGLHNKHAGVMALMERPIDVWNLKQICKKLQLPLEKGKTKRIDLLRMVADKLNNDLHVLVNERD